ncbi:hypothetical protein SAMN04487996_11310 [Dyadobacter soli]|uniref:Outer membrane protein beta-barrel domain-containing protein n=1 Tax=Dyadobacter soli TaxID=659014 RepID=A0A1G7PH74_9BACT|nr:hypothetical protein [Dyadobacter soli]SDF85646.1 hypothetical protein SAMN04487996_11310 [Dyadobacter soli]
MRHLYALLIAILPVFAYGQDALRKGHFEYGVFGGKQIFGKIYDERKMEAVSGWVAGIDLGYRDKSGISFHLQPNFSTFGSVWEIEESSTYHYRNEWKWSAVNVPLTARYTLGKGRVRPFAEAGLNLRLRTRLSSGYEFLRCGFCCCHPKVGVDDMQERMTHDPANILAAIGAEIDFQSVTIPIALRLTEGIGTYDVKPDPTPGSGYGALKTRVVQVTAGISIR